MLRIGTRRWAALAFIASLGACGSESGSVDDSSSGVTDDEDEATDEGEEDEDAPRKDAGKDAGRRDSGAVKPDSGTGRDAGMAVGDVPSGGGEALPCEVAAIVEDKCSHCHGAKPVSATFSLVTAADFQAPGNTDDSKKMYQVAQTRVTATSKPMPPDAKLSAEELKTLTDWLKDGAKPGAAGQKCNTGSTDGETQIPTKGGSGGAHATPIEYDDPDLECYKLTAFDRSGDLTQPYSVGQIPDFYVAFDVPAPWEGVKYARSMRSLVDNAEVLHHWLLFKQPLGGLPSVTENAVGAHPEGEMLYGWAPGGDDMYFDPDIGMEMDGSVLYQLEMHYNNTTGRNVPDASGVEICVTPTKPKTLAGLSWVGTDAILGSTEAIGLCTPSNTEPIRLISAQPHMHLAGKHMKVELTRASGTTEVIHDEPFSFEYQKSYFLDHTMMPGDSLTTTCTFSKPSVFGKGTNDEMCYFFTIHAPAGTLSSVGLGTAIHGANSCIAL